MNFGNVVIVVTTKSSLWTLVFPSMIAQLILKSHNLKAPQEKQNKTKKDLNCDEMSAKN